MLLGSRPIFFGEAATSANVVTVVRIPSLQRKAGEGAKKREHDRPADNSGADNGGADRSGADVGGRRRRRGQELAPEAKNV